MLAGRRRLPTGGSWYTDQTLVLSGENNMRKNTTRIEPVALRFPIFSIFLNKTAYIHEKLHRANLGRLKIRQHYEERYNLG